MNVCCSILFVYLFFGRGVLSFFVGGGVSENTGAFFSGPLQRDSIVSGVRKGHPYFGERPNLELGYWAVALVRALIVHELFLQPRKCRVYTTWDCGACAQDRGTHGARHTTYCRPQPSPTKSRRVLNKVRDEMPFAAMTVGNLRTRGSWADRTIPQEKNTTYNYTYPELNPPAIAS